MNGPVDPEAYKSWTPAAQEKALERLRQSENKNWRPFYCHDNECNGKPHDEFQWNHARKDQRPPMDLDWLVWMLMSGRGAGKTRAGAEYIHRAVRHMPRIALIAPTGPDARDTMIEGESGLVTIAPPGFRPLYEPSKRRLTWPNGAIGTVFSAEEPDRLRGPEHYCAWLDEPCFYPLVQDVWDNLMFGLRLGQRPRVVVTTTPKPRPWLKELLKDPTTRLSTVSTYANLENLSPVFAERVIKKYEGTRLGKQELHAEVLEDVEGALWTWELIERSRLSEPPEMERIVVAVDPAGSSKANADETAIIVVGRSGDHYYILDDRSGHYSPNGWAIATQHAYEDYSADAVVVEVNFGAEMVSSNLRNHKFTGRIQEVRAKKAKHIRAEPVVGLYEQSKVHHVGTFTDLETQLTEWVPYESDSPDRLDALVYGVTNQVRIGGPATISSPTHLRAIQGGRAS